MTTPRDLADKDEGFVLGKWFESISDLVDAHPGIAGHDRHKKIEYDRGSVKKPTRDFNHKVKGKRVESENERARAGRHIYKLGSAGSAGLDDEHLKMVRNAGMSFAIHDAVPPDVMLEKMQKLFSTGKKHGIGIAVHELKPGYIAIDITPPPQPKPVLKPKPPKFAPGKGF